MIMITPTSRLKRHPQRAAAILALLLFAMPAAARYQLDETEKREIRDRVETLVEQAQNLLAARPAAADDELHAVVLDFEGRAGYRTGANQPIRFAG